MEMIKHNVNRILNELPEGVQLVAAVKARRPEEIMEAVGAGVEIVGENYVQEAERAYETLGDKVK
ncbi:YggS family pyridoxal phosphate-dependent enzyme, partial [Chloroflexota bacterium]